ncbi:immunity protein Imm33 domain-containing protein [Acanthopleuribacter pedis]|uniref:immunity protein Imm33 domain-containing protein n=1 Tax=Acanthopleuribacter pedis TaxID=442870 RepID=UPI003C6EF4B8
MALLRLKVGISLHVKSEIQPLNGLRHQPEKGTSGWYIWAGVEIVCFWHIAGKVPYLVQ